MSTITATPLLEPGHAVDSQNPWLGLVAFTEELRDYFHGRGEEANELFRRVKREVLTVLFGQSGLGKTSLLQAGLFPRLRHEGFLPVAIRLSFDPQASELLRQVKESVAEALKKAELAEAPLPTPEETLWEYFHRLDFQWKDWGGKRVSLVLVFDQFEELFTLGQGREGGYSRIEPLLTELADLVENRAPAALEQRLEENPELVENFVFDRQDYRVLFSLREDYLPHLEDLRERMPAISHNRMRLTRMTGRRALEAVIKPGGELISPAVSRQVVRFVAGVHPQEATTRNGQGGADDLAGLEVDPALLSLVCRELNNRRLSLGLAQITADLLAGSSEHILHDYYERCVEDQTPAVRAFIEDELLTDSGFRENMALERARRLLTQRGAPASALDDLVQRRLLHMEERLGVRRIELTHDVLTNVIKKSRDERQQREAALEAQRHEQQIQEQFQEQLRQRWWRRTAGVMIVLLAIISALSIKLYRAKTEAEQQRDKAKQATAIVDIQKNAAWAESMCRNDWALLLATTAFDRTQKLQKLGQLPHPEYVYPEARRALLSALNRSPQLDRYVFTGRGKEPVLVVALSPDGRLLATVTPLEGSKAADKGGEDSDRDVIRLWRVEDRDHEESKLLAELKEHRGRVFSLAFSPDGTRLASGGRVPPYPGSGEILLWDLNDLSHPRLLTKLDSKTAPGETPRLASPVVRLAFHPCDHTRLAFATMATYHAKTEPPYFSWTPGKVELWDISTRSPVGDPGEGHMLSSAETMTLGLAFSPDGSRLVTGSGFDPDNNGDCTQGEVVLWDVTAFPKRIWDPEKVRLSDPRATDSPRAAVSELTFAPDGRLIAAGTVGGSVLLISADSGKVVKELTGGHQGPVMSLVFFPNTGKETFFPNTGKEILTLASGSNDTNVRLWKVNVTEPTKAQEIGQSMTAHVGGVRSLVFEPTGAGLRSAGSDMAVIRWNVTTHSPLSRALGWTGGRPQAVAYSPDGIVATGGTSTGPGGVVVQLWDESVALLTNDQPAGRERLATLQPLTGLEGRGKPVLGLAFSHDGRLLVGGDMAGNILYWDMARARDPKENRRPIPVAEFESAHIGPVNKVVSHPTRPMVASCGDDSRVVLWDVSDPVRIRLKHRLKHSGEVATAAFDPVNNRLATADWDRTIHLWDLSNPDRPVDALRGHAGAVLALDFSPDGKFLASGGMDATVFLWDVARREHGRPLRRHQRPVWDVKFCPVFRWQPFSRWLVSASKGEETNLMLWNIPESVDELPVPSPLKGHEGGVSRIAFRPLGEGGIPRLASVGYDSTLQLWDIDSPVWLEAARRAAGRGDLDPDEWNALVPGFQGEDRADAPRAPSTPATGR